MVVRTRLRRFTYPVILYLVSGGIGGYFVWHAINGDRGLKVSDEYQKSIAMLKAELDTTKAEKLAWQNRIKLMSGEAIDRDLLDEEARTLLGRVDKADLVIFYNRRR
ncbi:Septation inhibitor protein [Beijerinckiaceae bacterium RH AL1]|jgi:cell division protein FtsB|nr:septum formation initiator family protein [Beijerinckiaceae bacterium]VVB45875.1 Septation inhibitor protein [Beijerinckiaceae bacterium RH CH11]VVB45953.1 Septation inhibitor protein [Beijerinckiaceae bacterium RH AL8]VVC55085.1 Septation inhibitor protein [Beijerinckiaceae bacterium RH AL1]